MHTLLPKWLGLIAGVATLMFSLTSKADMGDISRIYHSKPAFNHIEICYGGGCVEHQVSTINADDWQIIVQVFKAVNNAQQERAAIAQAIGLLEFIMGKKIGTTTDRAGTFDSRHYKNQLDCNDEAINSTTYMRLMQQEGLMQFHAIEDMRTRDFFFTAWPHSTAVIHEVESGERFAVDSWFYDNGFPATIIPFALWKSGYVPQDSPIVKSSAIAHVVTDEVHTDATFAHESETSH